MTTLTALATAAAITVTSTFYPATMEITNISGDVVTMETATGHVYEMTGAEDYMTGDLVALIMDDNGTPDVRQNHFRPLCRILDRKRNDLQLRGITRSRRRECQPDRCRRRLSLKGPQNRFLKNRRHKMQDFSRYDYAISPEEIAALPAEIKETVLIIINGEYYTLKEAQND